GTIVDYGSCAPAAAFIAVFKKFAVDITVAEAREPMGRAKRDHIAAILAMPAVAERWQAEHGAVPTETDIDQLYEQFLPTQLSCLKDYSRLIPGALETVAELRRREIKIGSSTGYTHEIMKVVMGTAAEQGFEPDSMLCAGDVEYGRPAPWMCLENAKRMEVYPVQAIVKVDDTPVGIEAGRNAGMWTVGVTKSGNLVGLNEEELANVDASELQKKIDAAAERHFAAGAHYVIESVADLPAVLDDINSRSGSSFRS
ncbi:MAG: phosphonoacetaldehyde hydrolase, partial [Pirellulaceae bacterium]